MISALCCILVALVTLSRGSVGVPTEDHADGNISEDPLVNAASSNLMFSTVLYQVLSETPGNLLFSPFSVQVGLAALYLGAGGETANQMAKGLFLHPEKEVTKKGLQALVASMQINRNVTLEWACKIYADTRVKINRKFYDSSKMIFASDEDSLIDKADFRTRSERARYQINEWVKTKTHNKIKGVLPPGSITPRSSVLLVDAMYFKGAWDFKFDASKTIAMPFYQTPDEAKMVNMMHVVGRFPFARIDELGCRVIVLPFKGAKVVMVVLLPMDRDGLPALEAKLSGPETGELHSRLAETRVSLSLPKFKLSNYIDLEQSLEAVSTLSH